MRPFLLCSAALLITTVSAQTLSPQSLFTNLYAAATDGNLAAVQRWLAQGADINGQSPLTRGSALMAAAQNDRLDVVRYLLAQGADPSLRDWNGDTALDFARDTGDKVLIALLEAAQGGRSPAPKPASSQPAVPGTAAPKPAAPNVTASKTDWPTFGTFKVGDAVQVLTGSGWRKAVVTKVGPRPGQGGSFEKQYVVQRTDMTNWDDFYDWGLVAHVERQPYWTGYFVGDWKVGEMMAVNTRSDGTSAWNEVAYAKASDTLRVKADGTYEWKDLNAKVTKGRWTAAPDGPGVVVYDARGRSWTLRNSSNFVEERIRKLEGARLYPSDKSLMSMAASRPVRR